MPPKYGDSPSHPGRPDLLRPPSKPPPAAASRSGNRFRSGLDSGGMENRRGLATADPVGSRRREARCPRCSWRSATPSTDGADGFITVQGPHERPSVPRGAPRRFTSSRQTNGRVPRRSDHGRAPLGVTPLPHSCLPEASLCSPRAPGRAFFRFPAGAPGARGCLEPRQGNVAGHLFDPARYRGDTPIDSGAIRQ